MIKVFQGLIRDIQYGALTGGSDASAKGVVPEITFQLNTRVLRLEGPETRAFAEKHHLIIACVKSKEGWRILAWRNLMLERSSAFQLYRYLLPLPLWVAGGFVAYQHLPLFLLEALLNLGFVYGEILGKALAIGSAGWGLWASSREAWWQWKAHDLVAKTRLQDQDTD
jgi:hypothetical protein